MLTELQNQDRDIRHEPLSRWLGLRWPPGFLFPGSPCCAASPGLYTLGGQDALGNLQATCDKTQTTPETTSALASGNLSTVRYTMGSIANPAVAGYTLGGASSLSTVVAVADKMPFATETTAAQASAGISAARQELAGLSERQTKGYVAGGYDGTSKVTTADKLAFSTDSTAAQTSANLSQARAGLSAMNGDATKGYWGGGFTSDGRSQVATADKVIFSSDTTVAQASANLSTARYFSMAGSDGLSKGYWVGGQANGTPSNVVEKMTVSSDTTSAIAASFPKSLGASGSDGNKLLCMGGDDSTLNVTAGGEKMTFATDVASAVGTAGAGNLSSARAAPAGFTTVAL